MLRKSWPLLAGLLLLPGLVYGADAELAGKWKLTMLDQGRQPTLWLFQLESKDGKWTGKVLSAGEKLPESTLEDLSVTDDLVRFSIKIQDQSLSFEGKLPRDKSGNVRGSMVWINQQLFPAMLEPTALKSLTDSFEVNKEIVAKQGGDLRFFQATVGLLTAAGEKKARPEDVRGWAEKAYKAAEVYGPRWQGDIATQLADSLGGQDSYKEVALAYAQRAERLLDPKASSMAQFKTLNVLAAALKRAGNSEELKDVEARLDKIDLSIKAEKYAGRKGKSDRVLLVEMFTGAQCPPCVGADLAFDGLGKTYKPSEVVLLQYHLHIPGPDPMANAEAEARSSFYQVEGTPSLVLSGQSMPAQGGSFEEAPELYQAYRQVLDQLLERTTAAKLKASAVRKGNKIDIIAEVTEVAKPDDALKLRLVLVEEQVNYSGGNQLRHHHHVVRTFAGGAKGLPVKEKNVKHLATVDLDELRKSLAQYLNDYAKENPFPNANRPLELKNLKVVAFLQNDRTKEVIQAIQVDVGAAE